ncbi:DUF294 nucleotidyltransferase-like domain-containing protein [Hydromonas duriensis]|uniref:CBS domain-containing protein n=1 Tax=Hydromonas duriensis TaxID=1527608 RepID=A0A4R6YBU3_9BURK|nr:DUF294 nucleotidyltransferase-like domain-containing protein [Hydromonas duriensis]TDR33071.1 CBS domain-containing protein [Hydromonas duriensis]
MPNSFDFFTPPFDTLTVIEQDKVRQSLDVAYYPKGSEIVGVEVSEDTPLHLILKGEVHQLRGNAFVSSFGEQDWFDGKLVMMGRTEFRYVAAEEVVSYLLPASLIKQLAVENALFGSLLFADISERLNAAAMHDKRRELHSLAMARVKDAYLRKPHFVEAHVSVVEATRVLRERNASHVLVQDGERVGIFTNTNLCDAVLLNRDLNSMPVREAARFELLTIDLNDEITEALLIMIRHRIHRLVVMDNNQIVGVLGQLDLMSFFSNHSHLIAQQIDMAQDIEELRVASSQIEKFIRTQHGSGTKVSVIARMVQELNLQVFSKLWSLLAPMDVQLNTCVLVMGSEGRGEQVLRTDQDNALLIRDGFEYDGLAQVCERMNEELSIMGYPLCSGNMMMNNPLWRQHCSVFKKTITGWIFSSDTQAPVYLSTFLDAKVVCGDDTLFNDVRNHFLLGQRDYAGFINRFAQAINMFGDAEPSWWRKFLPIGGHDEMELDLKKVGIFPVVHGVRSLALEKGIVATSTKARIEALVQMGVLDVETGRNLIEALYFFLAVRLKNSLNLTIEQTGSAVNPKDLSALDRDLLKDCLNIVKDFKVFVSQHFHLEAF